ncbi:hypothetical protein MG5_05854 [Candida albicans P57072]|nr:hypothetical protein MG5_05854 [Candida albicans P57072]KGR06008.1 hypothetical protein MG9_05896 [Candida albicans P37037]KHC28944.1 hypothetical protein MGO_05827 [Candida albicans P76055]
MMINNTQCDMYQQQKKVCEKRKSHKKVTILKQNKLIPKLMKIFFSFEKKKETRNLRNMWVIFWPAHLIIQNSDTVSIV